jgi:hypothetical protein
MRRALTSLAGLLLLCAACEPEARRLLMVDMTLSDPLVLEHTAEPWHDAGYHVEYRRFYPHLTRADLARYRTVIVLGGDEPEGLSDALTIGDLAILTEWVRTRDGVVVLGYEGEGAGGRSKHDAGTLDRWVMNRWLAAQGAGISIGTEPVDAPAVPLPQSSLDNAGFQPFPAGRNRPLQVRERNQMLARGPGTALVAASRIANGLVVVVSRSLLGATDDDPKTRDYVVALARWTRRPAEWASVADALRPVPLLLAHAPEPVSVHPPPLAPPPGAAVVPLPTPVANARADTSPLPSWIARQGMRVLWSRSSPQSLDSLLRFVDVAALNGLSTPIPLAQLADTVGARNRWRLTAEQLQTSSVHWFPAISLMALASQGADEVDWDGELTPIACGLDSIFWRGTLRPTIRALAHLGSARPEVVTGVAFDLDSATTLFSGAGFCDADYRVGLAALALPRPELDRLSALPPTERYDTLSERGLLGPYFAALESAVTDRARALRAELRRVNPDVRFAFHATDVPADWLSLGLLRGLSSPDAPVFLWLRETRGRALLGRYRERGIYALAAVGLRPVRPTFVPAELARLRVWVFGEHAGFWLDGAASDSLARAIRHFTK